MLTLAFLHILLLIISTVHGAPVPPKKPTSKAPSQKLAKGNSPRPITSSSKPSKPSPQHRAFSPAGLAPYTQFARAAYCETEKVKKWACGGACKALPGFKVTLAGGDGNRVQRFFVGYWPTRKSIVIGHQGTDPTKVMSVLTDLNAIHVSLDPKRFPGAQKHMHVHAGFQSEHAITASQILGEVKKLMAAEKTNDVIVVGHSLGGALAELDALYLTLNIPSCKITAVTYGTPRVGNGDFVKLFDAKVPNFKRVNNKLDVVPIVPGRMLGYVHPHGEVHLLGGGKAVECPGNDSDDPMCQIKSVPNIAKGKIPDHLGPYEGISIGGAFCS